MYISLSIPLNDEGIVLGLYQNGGLFATVIAEVVLSRFEWVSASVFNFGL